MMMMGVFLIVLGVLAIAAPAVAGVSLTLMLGVLAIAAGAAQTAFALRARRGLGPIVWGVVTILAGAYMVSRPGVALATLTLFLAAYFLVSGLFEIMLAFQVRPARGWGWTLFGGVVSMLLALMIWRQFPVSGLWAVGTLLGIKLIFSGWTILSLRAAVATVAEAMSEAEP